MARRNLFLLIFLLFTAGAPAQGVLEGEPSEALGAALVAADFDGDGLDDLAVGAPRFTEGTSHYLGRVAVLRGGAGRPQARAQWWRGPTPGARFGFSLAAGDMDGDGKADLLIGAPSLHGGKGGVFLLRGGRGGLLGGGDLSGGGALAAFEGVIPTGGLGRTVASGDLDGDGLAELIIGQPNATVRHIPEAGRILVFKGRRRWKAGPLEIGRPGARPALVIVGREHEGLGSRLLTCDLDGDGCAELLAGSPLLSVRGRPASGSLLLFRGAKKLLARRRQITLGRGDEGPTLEIQGRTGGGLGEALATLDADGDGKPELIVSEPSRSRGRLHEAGLVHVLPASLTGVLDVDAVPGGLIIAGQAHGERLGAVLETGRDSSGKTLLLVGSPRAGRVALFAPRFSKQDPPAPITAWMPPSGGKGRFGTTLATGRFRSRERFMAAVGEPRAGRVHFFPLP